eukprot:5095702-Karenia_brevis.AAC.1
MMAHREFRDAVLSVSELNWTDFPVKGPRSVLWVLKFMDENGGTPLGWHAKWRADGKLQATDAGVATHELACKMLQT